MAVLFQRVALIGLGLIGSSISHAARRGGLAGEIVGAARTAKTREAAQRLGLVAQVHDNNAQAVAGADLIVLCVPVGACGAVAREIAPHLKPGAVVTDVGSVKASVVAAVAPHLPEGVHFVPGHPIAGTEYSGPEAGFAALFDGRWCILTPPEGTDAQAVAQLKAFWEGLGSYVEVMAPDDHDLVLAITSHLPHLIAYNIVNTAAHLERVQDADVIKFSAGGFRDFTRIAASDPTMWRDVFLNNKEATLEMLGQFSENLAELQRAIRFGDGETLFRLFTEARAIRRGILDAGQDVAGPDFGRIAPAAQSEKERSGIKRAADAVDRKSGS